MSLIYEVKGKMKGKREREEPCHICGHYHDVRGMPNIRSIAPARALEVHLQFCFTIIGMSICFAEQHTNVYTRFKVQISSACLLVHVHRFMLSIQQLFT